jgi:hypothetical protein
MKIPRALGTFVVGFALTLAGPAWPAIDFEQGPIDPFESFSAGGVTFTVDPAFFASAGDSLWSDLDYDFVLDSALELQPGGMLTIELDVVAASLEFGVARQGASDLFEIASVEVLDADGLPVQTLIELPIFAGDTAPERRFSASGVKRVIVTLDPFADEALGIDNVVYAPVPEPSTWAMLLGGLLLLAPAIRRVR